MTNKTIIFAHYDKNSIIDDYVIFYLKELHKIADTIIFVSDCNLSNKELSKLDGITTHNIAKNHGEYDWGSYKYGYKYLYENNLLESIDELILCNDSVYGPIYPLENYINTLSNSNSDFSGFFKNIFNYYEKEDIAHLQSWFLLLKKQVFNSSQFKNFILSVKNLNNKKDIVNNYEIGFTTEMSRYFTYDYLYTSLNYDAVYRSPVKLIKNGFPFCKVIMPTKYNIYGFLKEKNKKLSELIKKHQKRCFKRNVIENILRTVINIKKITNCKIIKSSNLKLENDFQRNNYDII